MTEDKIVEFLDKFSAKIAEVSGQGFEYLAQYNATAALTNIIVLSIVTLVLSLLLAYGIKGSIQECKEEKEVPVYSVITIISGFLLFIAMLVWVCGSSEWVATVQNPEGSVLKDILRRL